MKQSIFTLFAIFTLVASAQAGTTKTTDQGTDLCANDDHYPLVQKKDLKQWVAEKKAFVIDVNSAESFKSNHVPTAIHYAEHKKDLAKLLPKDKDATIVAYCGGPACEAWKNAAKEACKLKYTHVYHFKEGISGWMKD